MPKPLTFPYRTLNPVNKNDPTQSGIAYGELPGYTETYDRELGQSKRILICNWHDASVFPTVMMGDVSRAGDGATLKRYLPEEHPRQALGHCIGLTLQNGIGSPVTDAGFQLIRYGDLVNDLDGVAVWEATYQPLPFAVQVDDSLADPNKPGAAIAGNEILRFVQREVHFGIEVYKLPGNAFKWASGSQRSITRVDNTGKVISDTRNLVDAPIPEGMTKMRSINQRKFIWHWVPEPIPTAWQQCVGMINDANFDGVQGNQSFKPGSLLCMSPEISERFYTPAGTPVRNITFVLAERPDTPTWNFFYRTQLPGGPDFDEVVGVQSNAGQRQPGPFKTANFGNLFITG